MEECRFLLRTVGEPAMQTAAAGDSWAIKSVSSQEAGKWLLIDVYSWHHK